MKLNSPTWIVLSTSLALLIFAAGFAFRQHQRAASAITQLTAVEQEKSTLRREIEKLAHQLQQPPSVSPNAVTENPVTLSSAEPSDQSPITPEVIAALRLESGRADVRSFYEPFFSQRRFSREKAAAFTERIARYNERREILASELPVNGIHDRDDPTVVAFKARQQEEETRFHAELESFLGPDDFVRFQQFQPEARFWTPVKRLAGQLHDTDTPLTSDQANRLASVLVAQATDASGKIGPAVTDWDSVFNQAAGLLTPPQLAVLKTQHDYDETWRKLNRLSGRASAAARAAASEKR